MKIKSRLKAQYVKLEEKETEDTMKMIKFLNKTVPKAVELCSALGKDTVIAGGAVLCALTNGFGKNEFPSDINIFTTNSEIIKTLISIGYELIEPSATKDKVYNSSSNISGILTMIHPDWKDKKYPSVQVIYVKSAFIGKLDKFIEADFDFDFCRVYFDGSCVHGFDPVNRACTVDLYRLADIRSVVRESDILFLVKRTINRADKYTKRGYNIKLIYKTDKRTMDEIDETIYNELVSMDFKQ